MSEKFTDHGKISINTPPFAAGSLCHGDIITVGHEYWFYFQGTNDGGKRFQIGLAKQPIPAVVPEKK